jgi:hypothetical protein
MSREDAHYNYRRKHPEMYAAKAPRLKNGRFHSNSNTEIAPPEKGKMNFEQGITGTGI